MGLRLKLNAFFSVAGAQKCIGMRNLNFLPLLFKTSFISNELCQLVSSFCATKMYRNGCLKDIKISLTLLHLRKLFPNKVVYLIELPICNAK